MPVAFVIVIVLFPGVKVAGTDDELKVTNADVPVMAVTTFDAFSYGMQFDTLNFVGVPLTLKVTIPPVVPPFKTLTVLDAE